MDWTSWIVDAASIGAVIVLGVIAWPGMRKEWGRLRRLTPDERAEEAKRERDKRGGW